MTHFYLGTHEVHWLATADVPLFVSHRRLRGRKTLPKVGRRGYAVDSGGFSELSLYGTWRTTPEEYVTAIARYDAEIGHMDWAAPQDWMCEPPMLAKTGLAVAEHQRRTVANFARLSQLWPEHSDAECPFMPVLQGWEMDDYLTCWRMYEDAGINPREYETVGVGSICRRPNIDDIGAIAEALHELDTGVPLHGFGVKTEGLAKYGDLFASADSLAWSRAARWEAPLSGCTAHKNCANCLTYALQWRDRVLELAA